MTAELLDVAIKEALSKPWPEGVAPTIWTIGHGTKTHDEIIEVLDAYSIDALVDCRFKPFSRWNPQWCMPPIRARFGKRYVAAGSSLGNPAGMGGAPIAPDVYNAAITMLVQKAKAHARIMLMCSEGDYKKCHRHSMIGHSLDQRGVIVVHLIRPKDSDWVEVPTRSQEMVRSGTVSSLFR